jgi:hypothetical protein
MSGLAWMLRRLAEGALGSPRRSKMAGQGTASTAAAIRVVTCGGACGIWLYRRSRLAIMRV